jgi:excisionase family DNA binding protein
MNNLLSVKQAAFILRVHPLTIRRYIKSKKLKAVKIGGNIRIEEDSLQNFHKDIESPEQQPRIFKTSRISDKTFTQDDPLLRLQGRGAGLVLQENK